MISTLSTERGLTLWPSVTTCALLFTLALAPWWMGCADAIGEFYLTAAVGMAILSSGATLATEPSAIWRGDKTAIWLICGFLVMGAIAVLHLFLVTSSLQAVVAPGVTNWIQKLPTASPLEALPKTVDWQASSRIGLNAGGSMQFAVRLMLAACVTMIVCTHHNTARLLRMLAILSAVVGTAVAVFGLAQHIGSHDGLLYWRIPVEGGLGFGPFINRNHYPFFLNLSLGLTVGLLLDRLERSRMSWHAAASDPVLAWLVAAIGLMSASLIVCVSRGGLLSGFLSIAIVCMLRFRVHAASRGILAAVLIALVVVTLLIWVGFDLQASRLNMLAQADRYQSDGRWYLWQAAFRSVPEFLWFGSGGETYRHWETIYPVGDVQWNGSDAISLRADNEFLDVLNEYGLFGLAGILLVSGAVTFQIWRSSREDGLAAGASMGLLAVLLHSTVDFGLRVPSTGLLAVVVAALLCSRRTPKASRRSLQRSGVTRQQPSSASSSESSQRPIFRRSANLIIAIAMIVLSITAIRVRRRYFDAEQARLSARQQLSDFAYPDAIVSMQRAVAATPEDVFMRTELIRIAEYVSDRARNDEERRSAIAMILQHSEILRRLCPITWRPYAWIAQYDDSLDPASRLAWARAAKRLHPTQPDLSFLVGRLEAEQNGLRSALPHWRDSLASSLKHTDQILTLVGDNLPARDFVDDLMPNDPVVTLTVAERVEGDTRRQLLERTQALLVEPKRTNRRFEPGELYELRSRTLSGLGRDDEAIAMIRRAINEDPTKADWRLLMAQWCVEQDRLDEAVREIRIVLRMQPDNRSAKTLQLEVAALKADVSRSSARDGRESAD
ncbi:MAG: O-antigen ligase family protein [Planctomycetota bacterium]